MGDFGLSVHPQTELGRFGDVLIIGTVEAIHGTVQGATIGRKWDDLTGRFAAVVLDDNPYVLQDAVGARTVFYRSGGGAIASHPGLLAEAYGHGKNEVAHEFIKNPGYTSRSVTYLPGLMTMHEGIRPLIPNHLLRLNSGRVERFWPVEPKKETALREFDTEFDALLDAVAKTPLPILGVTGGIDTRVLVAGLRSRNVAFRAVTWAPPRIVKKEVPVVERTVELLGLDHKWLEHEATSEDPIAAISGVNSGGFRGRARITADTARLYDNGTFVRGYGGEIIRGFYNLRQRKMTGSGVEEMVEAYGSSMKDKEQDARYWRIVTDAFEEFSDVCDYSDLKGFDVNDVFYWEHRMGIWGACMHNEMDAAVYSTTGINSRRLFELSYGRSDEERLSKDFLNRIVVANVPAMASVKVV